MDEREGVGAAADVATEMATAAAEASAVVADVAAAEVDGAGAAVVSPERWMSRAALFELLSLGLLKPEPAVGEALVSGEYAAACAEVLAALGSEGADAEGAVALGGEGTDAEGAVALLAAYEGTDAEGVALLLAAYEGADADEVYHQALREYTRLFVGEREPLVTPFAGVRVALARGQQGLLFVGKESMAIERFMRRCGVAKDLAAGQSNDPVDHIGTMCEFMKFLCLVNAQAVAPAEGAVVQPDDYETFMAEHFAPYATWCAAQVRELSAVPFYQALADLLDVAVAESE